MTWQGSRAIILYNKEATTLNFFLVEVRAMFNKNSDVY
jgi:hypothetical protein